MTKRQELKKVMKDLTESITPTTPAMQEYKTRKNIGNNKTPKKKKRK